VEDREAGKERHAVGYQVGAVNDEDPLPVGVPHLQRPDAGVVTGQAEHGPGPQGHQPERQGLLQQVRLALALPCPAAQHVAHRCPDDRAQDPGQAAAQVEHTKEQAERDEARAQGRDRHQHEPAEPLADRGTELALDSRADPGQNRCHVIPSFTGGPWAIRSRLQYGSIRVRVTGGIRALPGPRYRAHEPHAWIAARLGPDSQLPRSMATAAGSADAYRHRHLTCPPVPPRNHAGRAQAGMPITRPRQLTA
jgi:hypothetical protein